MKNLESIIKERRSIRKYKTIDIPDEMLNKVLDSLRWSPSWANTQCWEIIVIKSKLIKDKLEKTISDKNPAIKSINKAPVTLALCAKLDISGYYKNQVTTKFGDWFMFDLGIATQTICLTAHSLGLGTVIIGLFDHEKAKKILNIPKGYELVSLISLGYPDQNPKAPKRKEINEFVHFDEF